MYARGMCHLEEVPGMGSNPFHSTKKERKSIKEEGTIKKERYATNVSSDYLFVCTGRGGAHHDGFAFTHFLSSNSFPS